MKNLCEESCKVVLVAGAICFAAACALLVAGCPARERSPQYMLPNRCVLAMQNHKTVLQLI